MPSKSWKNHLKKLLTLAEIPSFQKFFITAQTAKMADFMFQNMAYRATVYRTGVNLRMIFWCLQIFQKVNLFFDRFSSQPLKWFKSLQIKYMYRSLLPLQEFYFPSYGFGGISRWYLKFFNNLDWFPVGTSDNFRYNKIKNIISIAPWVSTLFKIK